MNATPIRATILLATLLAAVGPAWAEAPAERFRPRYHFTPPRNFMNDPNGLVFHNGIYHLFYQHNPEGDRWGHMSWGHAVSPDLVRWSHKPLAIREDEPAGIMIFSGSAVDDRANTSGLGMGGKGPLVAIYTGHSKGKQAQHIASSTDGGTTWTKFAGNPVVDIGSAEFRDPKVFRHWPTDRWIMVTVLATEHKIRFLGSKDLKQWEHLSDFGPSGAVGGVWECPDLFPLAVDGKPGRLKWVLKVDLGDGAVAGGSGGQYFVGEFDGKTFTADDPASPPRWIDFGRDFYASQSWSDIPESDGRRIWIGWMNNWRYANDVPTAPFRGQCTIPRSLGLRSTPAGPVLVQAPVAELKTLRGTPRNLGRVDIAQGTTPIEPGGEALEIAVEFEPMEAEEVGIAVRRGDNQETRIGYDAAKGTMFVDRRASGDSKFHAGFVGRHDAPLALEQGRVSLRIFVDVASVEVFGGDGRAAITDLIFPGPGSGGLALFAEGGPARATGLQIWDLKKAE